MPLAHGHAHCRHLRLPARGVGAHSGGHPKSYPAAGHRPTCGHAAESMPCVQGPVLQQIRAASERERRGRDGDRYQPAAAAGLPPTGHVAGELHSIERFQECNRSSTALGSSGDRHQPAAAAPAGLPTAGHVSGEVFPFELLEKLPRVVQYRDGGIYLRQQLVYHRLGTSQVSRTRRDTNARHRKSNRVCASETDTNLRHQLVYYWLGTSQAR